MPFPNGGAQVWSAWRAGPDRFTYWEGWWTPRGPEEWYLTPHGAWVLIGYRAITPEGELGSGVFPREHGYARQEVGGGRVHEYGDRFLSPDQFRGRVKGHPNYAPIKGDDPIARGWCHRVKGQGQCRAREPRNITAKGQGSASHTFAEPMWLPKGGGQGVPKGGHAHEDHGLPQGGKGKGISQADLEGGTFESDIQRRIRESAAASMALRWGDGLTNFLRQQMPSANSVLSTSPAPSTLRQCVLLRLEAATVARVEYLEVVLACIIGWARGRDRPTAIRIRGIIRMAGRDRRQWLRRNLKPPGLG